LNLSVSKKVADLLEAKGYTVVMARENDKYLSLSHRAQEANKLGADIFVSIHHNAFNGSSHGIETFYYNEAGTTNNPKANDKERIQDSKKMAEEVQKELIKETGAYDRGVKRANFHVIRETKMPSILVEGGFVDNAVERAKLVLDSYQQKLANAITKGIEKFFSIWN
jgi:N-acetylmuramoyl-L-alanine amidase